MKFNIHEYKKTLEDNNISVIYSGPIWAGGIDGMAEMLLKRLEYDELALSASQSIFSIFVEQMNNMLMYSAEKENHTDSMKAQHETSRGMFILGIHGSTYVIQSGNMVTDAGAGILKTRIDYLNTLGKSELRQYYKQQLKEENDNLESKGAGIGLIEIARRASAPIDYEFEPYGNGLQYFSMYITVQKQKGGDA